MPETLIVNFKHPFAAGESIYSQVEDIFFETSSKKEFKDNKERDEFKWKYLGFYLAHYPEYAWIALNGDEVLGYVLGMPWSKDPSLYAIQPHLKPFESVFESYPAHLHINCHPKAQGKGIGRKLVMKLLDQLKSQGVSGLHIMTGPASDNRLFYQKLGFDFEVTINSILLMGISIQH